MGITLQLSTYLLDFYFKSFKFLSKKTLDLFMISFLINQIDCLILILAITFSTELRHLFLTVAGGS